jgi:hypothetical protein
MSPAAFSVAVYGAYLLLNGVGLVLSPALPLGLLGLPVPNEPWARLFGLVAGEIGFYFVFAARNELAAFFRAAIYGRASAAAIFLVLVLLHIGPVQLLLFAAVDLLAAAWTQLTLRPLRRRSATTQEAPSK